MRSDNSGFVDLDRILSWNRLWRILDKYLKKSQVATPNIVLLKIAGKYIRERLPKGSCWS